MWPMPGPDVPDPAGSPTIADPTWLSRHRRGAPAATARFAAYTIPPIGSSPAVHRELAQSIDSDIEVLTVRLPGRESRRDEPPLPSMAGCVADLAPRLASHAAEHRLPYAFVGDCATSLLAFELARELERTTGMPPVAVVAIAGRSPRYGYRDKDTHRATSEQLRDDVTASSLMPAEITRDPDVFALFEATVRADLAVYETYRWDEQPSQLPVTVLLPRDLMADPRFTTWREASRRTTRFVGVDASARTAGQVTAAITPPPELARVLAALRDGSAATDQPEAGTRAHVVAAWTSLLPEAQGADEEHFLDAGGDSLLAVRLRNALRERIGRAPSLELILRGVTLGELVAHLDGTS
jgi:surfactin synthase thioesterase subunit